MPAGVEARVVELLLAHPGWGPRTIRSRLAAEGVDPLPGVEARVVEMRREHAGWGPRTIRTHLAREGVTPLPGRSSIHRALLRHGLIDATPRRRRRSEYRRWERSRSMELWQMDIVGRFHLADGSEVKVVTGVDDHSRFCVCARIVARATARPVVAALRHALGAHGVPSQILTDNGKVFTARFGLGPGPVLFDQACTANRLGRRHVDPDTGEIADELEHAAPAPVARPAGVTRWADQRGHLSLAGFRCRVGASLARDLVEAGVTGGLVQMFHQQALVATHVQRRPPQNGRPKREVSTVPRAGRPARGPSVVRMADANGSISFAEAMYRAGRMWASQQVTVTSVAGSVQLSVDGKLVRVHPARHDPAKEHDAFATPNGWPRNRRGVA